MSRRMDPVSSPGAVLELIHSGRATSRAAITRALGIAPSTASIRVNQLIDLGLVVEKGVAASTGGRQARVLEIRADAGVVASVLLGSTHATLWLADLLGQRVAELSLALDLTAAADVLIADIWNAIETALRDHDLDVTRLRGIILGFPAPVNQQRGVIGTPSLVPSLQGVDIEKLMRTHSAAALLVENDANLLAVGESALSPDAGSNILAIKLGRRIGAGLILNGALYRGQSGTAGEISHLRVSGKSTVSCTCGIDDCLESVASGGAIIAQLQKAGYDDAKTTSDVVKLSRTQDSTVAAILREGGERIGEVLASITNVFNPSAVIFGGALSQCDTLIGAVRGTIFQRTLPVTSASLSVGVGRGEADAEGIGAMTLILRRVLAPEVIDRQLD